MARPTCSSWRWTFLSLSGESLVRALNVAKLKLNLWIITTGITIFLIFQIDAVIVVIPTIHLKSFGYTKNKIFKEQCPVLTTISNGYRRNRWETQLEPWNSCQIVQKYCTFWNRPEYYVIYLSLWSIFLVLWCQLSHLCLCHISRKFSAKRTLKVNDIRPKF